MRILLVAATSFEVAPLAGRLTATADSSERVRTFTHGPHHLDILTAGVGMVATAAGCARALASHGYDLAINLGVCGSFNAAYPPGSVVNVVTDCFPELGAEDGERFLTVHELGLLGMDDPPFRGGKLVNAEPGVNAAAAALPRAAGITVNTVHGDDGSIARVVERLTPDVETMEGAAFMYACLTSGVRFAQLRAVSNMVERRNRAAWKLPEAVAALNEVAMRAIEAS
jgi:futalosine hydrolase